MLAASIAVALALWGTPPCTVAYHAVPIPGPALGVTRWPKPGYCEVLLDSERPWLWKELCAVVLHETGHVVNYWDPVGVVNLDTGGVDHFHSPDPRNVMFPRLVRRAAACIGKRPPQFRRGAIIDLRPSAAPARTSVGPPPPTQSDRLPTL